VNCPTQLSKKIDVSALGFTDNTTCDLGTCNCGQETGATCVPTNGVVGAGDCTTSPVDVGTTCKPLPMAVDFYQLDMVPSVGSCPSPQGVAGVHPNTTAQDPYTICCP
jgi:hypothetical protein